MSHYVYIKDSDGKIHELESFNGTTKERTITVQERDETGKLLFDSNNKPVTKKEKETVFDKWGHYVFTDSKIKLSPIELDRKMKAEGFVWLTATEAEKQRENRIIKSVSRGGKLI